MNISNGVVPRVLSRGLAYVADLAARKVVVNFPFPHFDIKCWLELAREDCLCARELQEAVGGTPFDYDDPETYWSSTSQFLTWWKNNVNISCYLTNY
jgi:hypothetical protein